MTRSVRTRLGTTGHLSLAALAALALGAGCSGASNDAAAPAKAEEPRQIAQSASAGPSFFAEAPQSGSIEVSLRPTEAVSPGSPTLVTFGVPFPRGTISDCTQIRVLKDGQEIPAHVDIATPWRSITDPAKDGTSVRVARVQVSVAFAAGFPSAEPITVAWGQPRTKDVPSLAPPRSAWHTVQSGTFAAADGVSEPDVYAVLPKAWLVDAGLTMRMNPVADAVAETREDPSVALNELLPGYQKRDQSMVNFFYTQINQDGPTVTATYQNQYKTGSEPWLYDRSGTFFHGYVASGHFAQLREAVRASQYYAKHIYRPESGAAARNVGMFDLKVTDKNGWPGGNGAMYSYVEPFAMTYWLTGDDTLHEYVPWIINAHESDEDTRWSPDAVTWTERHTSFHLLAHTFAYELTGKPEHKAVIQKGVDDFVWHQNGAGGAFPGAIDGALWHYASQHGDGDGVMASPWMSALTVNAMLRAYLVSDDPRIPGFVARMGAFEKASVKLWQPDEHAYDNTTSPLKMSDYVTSPDGSTNVHNPDDGEHALDVATVLAWAGYFADATGSPDPALRALADELYQDTYQTVVRYWTRPAGPAAGKPAYRSSPDRKYGWQYHNTGSFSWLMSPPSQPSAPAAPPPAGTTTPPAESPAPDGTSVPSGSPPPPDGTSVPPGSAPPPDGTVVPSGSTAPDSTATPPAGGTAPDTGSTPPDTGSTPDTGTAPPDTGTTPDSGSTPPGGGTTPETGTTPPDTTQPGGSTPDTGAGGSPTDTGSGGQGGSPADTGEGGQAGSPSGGEAGGQGGSAPGTTTPGTTTPGAQPGCGGGAGTAEAQNLLSNPSFESWSQGSPEGWQALGGSTLTRSTVSEQGSSAVEITSSAGGIAQAVGFSPVWASGVTVTFEGHVRAAGCYVGLPVVQITAEYADGAAAETVTQLAPDWSAGGWVKASVSLKTSHPLAKVTVRVLGSTAPAQSFFADDLKLTVQ